MNTQIEKNYQDKPLELCCWCDIPLATASLYKGLVCVRCYKLLISAGLRDEEIFKNKTKESDEKG